MYTLFVGRGKDKRKQLQISNVKPYQTLLEVCLNHQILLNHDCGGVCHCTTCHIYVAKGGEFLEQPSRREMHFLERCANRQPESRLACQCLLNEGTGLVEILIPEQKEE